MESRDAKLLELIFDGSIIPRDVKLSALESITQNFSEERIIGEGGFATVYKGVLRNGEVAVKKIKNNQTIDEKLFRREVNSLLNVSHKNIVRFLGFCSHTEHKAVDYEGSGEYIYAEDRERVLCFEYINNGSLDKYIADELRGLPWDTRVLIIKGICEGLQYLHIEKQIIHRDLKPANILIDNNMEAKITDFGLSRREENAQTKSTTRVSSPGYTAPEYIEKGEMSVKYDVYSLGIIIMELVTGYRSIPDRNNVLRRWSHRWHKSGKATPFRYQQITKLIEIGLLCQEKDPYKRPFISDIVRMINELENTDRQISSANQPTVGQISPYLEDDMLGIEPLELRFPFKLNNKISCSLELTNETNAFIAFNIQTTSPLQYFIQPEKDIVAPRSRCSVNITLQPLDKAPQDRQYTGDFIVRSTKVNGSLIGEDITEDTFNTGKGKLVDEVNLTITYKAEVPQVEVSPGSLIISDTRNLHSPQASNVPPIEAESKISASTSDEVIQFDPPEICFPLVPHKKVVSSIKMINTTETYVSFRVSFSKKSTANYSWNNSASILPPRSKHWLRVIREEKEDRVEDIQFNEEMFVWYAIVAEDIKASDLDLGDYSEWKNLPIILTKISASTSDEVIRFIPAEFSFPSVQDKKVLSSIRMCNTTEAYVSFILCFSGKNSGNYSQNNSASIMPPRSTQWLTLTREEKKDAVEDMQINDEVFVWYAITAEEIKVGELNFRDYNDRKKLPIVLTKINSCTSNELIQFDPPMLNFPCLNKTSLSWVNLVNITDCYIGFNTWSFDNSVESYNTEPVEGILPPRSTQRMLVKRVPKEKEPQDMECKNNIFVWNMIVAEGVEASSFSDYTTNEDSKEIPLNFQMISPCTSDELIRLDHPGLHFTFSQNKTALSSVNMVNVTDYYVGFRLFNGDANSVCYHTDTRSEILTPRSAQRLVIARQMNEMEPDDMEYNDKFFMWNAIVSEGIKASDLDCRLSLNVEQSNELPIILNKVTSSTSVELIKLEPPEICFPFLPSKSLLSSIKIVNITDYHIGFNTAVEKTNLASYITEPPCGILPPWSTQELVVTRVAKDEAPELEDMQCKDKYYVWSGFVTEHVNASDLSRYMPENERKELPIVFTETGSNELIQFDPPELCLPLLPGQRVLSSAKIVNVTDQYIGFRICTKKSNSARYNANPSEGILLPLSTQVLLVTRIAEEKKLVDTQCKDKFLVWNGIVTQDVKASDVIDSMSEPKCTELPIVLTKTSSSISDELIQFDPPELHFPFLPNKKVSTSIKIVNLTDYTVGFNTYSRPTNAAWYHTEPPRGFLPPRSTQKLMVTREGKEDALKDKQFDDKYFVWKSIVSEAEGVKDSELSDYMADQESKELHIVLDKISSSISDELIQLDPAELSIPLLLNKIMFFRVNVVNTTDFYVAFNAYWIERNAPRYKSSRKKGILPPRSTEKYIMRWVTTETELEDMECAEDFFVWNRVVTERVESGDIISYMGEEESKKLPLILTKGSPLTSNELIQFDPPELSLPFMPNKPLVFSVKIVNNTDYCVGFDKYQRRRNVGWYYINPAGGVMPPRSTRRLVVKRVPDEKEGDDMRCKDKFLLWSSLVSEGVQVSDFVDSINYRGSKELPIAYKTSLCSSDELIQFDPPQLPFPFLPNKGVSMFRKFKIVNVTDHSVGFSIWSHQDNSAWYIIEPEEGILPPQSTQAIKVRRTLKENETEDMQCKDKIFVWNGIVTEGIEVSDVGEYWKNEDKELSVVLTKPGESSPM